MHSGLSKWVLGVHLLVLECHFNPKFILLLIECTHSTLYANLSNIIHRVNGKQCCCGSKSVGLTMIPSDLQCFQIMDIIAKVYPSLTGHTLIFMMVNSF